MPAGNPSFGAGLYKGIEIGLERGIGIGLALAAEATRQNRLRLIDTAAKVVSHTVPAVMSAVREHRAQKASRPTT